MKLFFAAFLLLVGVMLFGCFYNPNECRDSQETPNACLAESLRIWKSTHRMSLGVCPESQNAFFNEKYCSVDAKKVDCDALADLKKVRNLTCETKMERLPKLVDLGVNGQVVNVVYRFVNESQGTYCQYSEVRNVTTEYCG